MKNLLQMAVAAALLLGSPAAYAQFGGIGKKLKEKAKQKVEQKVDQTINKTVNNAVDKTGEAIESTVNKAAKKGKKKVAEKAGINAGEAGSSNDGKTGSAFDWKKNYTPGAEARAKDPNATSAEVWKGFNKSVGQLHGAYENMADFTANYQPYYDENNKYYWMLDDDSQNRILNAFLSVFKLQMSSDIDHKKTLDMWGEVADGMVVPADEMFLNAYQTQYIADPTSDQALLYYLYADTYLNNMPFSQMRYALKDDFTTEDGNILPKNFYTQRKERRRQADELANELASYDSMLSWAEKYFDNAYSQSDPYAAYFQLLIGKNILENCLPNHKDFNEDDTRYRKLAAKNDGSKNWKIEQAFITSYVNPDLRPDWIPKNPGNAVAMPKGVTVSAAVQKEAEKAAKAYAGVYYKKVLFKNGKWFDLKSHEWPYRKNGEQTAVYIIVEYQGKSYVLETGLTRGVKGNNYRIQTPVGNMAQPLK